MSYSKEDFFRDSLKNKEGYYELLLSIFNNARQDKARQFALDILAESVDDKNLATIIYNFHLACGEFLQHSLYNTFSIIGGYDAYYHIGELPEGYELIIRKKKDE